MKFELPKEDPKCLRNIQAQPASEELSEEASDNDADSLDSLEYSVSDDELSDCSGSDYYFEVNPEPVETELQEEDPKCLHNNMQARPARKVLSEEATDNDTDSLSYSVADDELSDSSGPDHYFEILDLQEDPKCLHSNMQARPARKGLSDLEPVKLTGRKRERKEIYPAPRPRKRRRLAISQLAATTKTETKLSKREDPRFLCKLQLTPASGILPKEAEAEAEVEAIVDIEEDASLGYCEDDATSAVGSIANAHSSATSTDSVLDENNIRRAASNDGDTEVRSTQSIGFDEELGSTFTNGVRRSRRIATPLGSFRDKHGRRRSCRIKNLG